MEVAKQLLRSTSVTTKNHLICHYTNMTPSINRMLELKNEATKPTDILENKRSI